MRLPKRPRLAVLIDAENVSHKIAAALLRETADMGDAIVREVYGDFASPGLQGWRGALGPHALTPRQTPGVVGGKNAADIALVIGAMELLQAGFEAFCLVSSDSDFTALALKLRAAGRATCGVGRADAAPVLRNAYQRYIPVETLLPASAAPVPVPPPAPRPPARVEDAIRLIDRALDAEAGPDGRVRLCSLGSRLKTISPDFSPKAFGDKKLRELLDSLGVYKVTGAKVDIWVERKAPPPVIRH